MNSLLHSKGLYYAVNKTSIFVCINNTDPQCKEKMEQRFFSYPLDILMSKGAREFCEEIMEKGEGSILKTRTPKCNWCMSSIQVFDNAVRQRGQEGALNLTQSYCKETEVMTPFYTTNCHEVVQEFWKVGQAKIDVCKKAGVC